MVTPGRPSRCHRQRGHVRNPAAGVSAIVSHVGCGDQIAMRLVRQENLEQLTVALMRCTVERVEALAKQHAVSSDEILRVLIANALRLEDDLATRYDEMARRLEQ